MDVSHPKYRGSLRILPSGNPRGGVRVRRRNPHDARRRTGAGQDPTAPQANLRALLQTDADFFPGTENCILRVSIPCTASDEGNNAVAALLEVPNQIRTVFPGTSLRMVYEVPANETASDPAGSEIPVRSQEL